MRSHFPQAGRQKVAVALAALLLAACAGKETKSDFSGTSFPIVASVHDGDTLTLSTGTKIRLAEVDAPESCQPGGPESMASLRALCAGQPAEVTPTARDRYGRTVARIACAGTDASTHQVASGWAWVYRAYAPTDSSLYPLERAATDRHAGLWASPAVPPWDFRRQHGPCR